MAQVAGIEKELLDATGYKPPRGAKRQDMMAGLVRAAADMKSDDFDSLSDEAAEWCESATKAMNIKEDIPEFEPEEADETTDETSNDTEHEADEAAQANGADTKGGEAEDEDEEPQPKGKVKQPTDKVAKAAKKAEGKKITEHYEAITGETDRYGITKGTLTAKAVEMYEKGATAKQIKDELGGRHYNVLTRLTDAGHRVEKIEGGVWKLTHKNDLNKAKSKKKG